MASCEKLLKEAAIRMAWYPSAEIVDEEDDRERIRFLRKKSSLQTWLGSQQRTLQDLHVNVCQEGSPRVHTKL